MTSSIEPSYRRSSGLVDVLDRVLDKGLVIAGDIRVSLAEVELITIRIRLLVCSIDKAEQIGLDWWRQDPNLSVAARQPDRRERSCCGSRCRRWKNEWPRWHWKPSAGRREPELHGLKQS